MKRVFALLLATLMLSSLACQPTPEEDIVVNRAEGNLEERIFASPAPIETEAITPADGETLSPFEESTTGAQTFPERWMGDISTEYVTVRIDAEIITSGQQTYPVYMVEQNYFSIEDYLRLFQSVIPNAVKYRRNMSYEDYETQLESAVRGAEKRDADGSITYVSWPQQQNVIESAQEKMLGATREEQLYKDIDEDAIPQEFILCDDGTQAWAEYSSSIITLSRDRGILETESGGHLELWDEDVAVSFYPEIYEADAQAVAEQFLKDIGIEGVGVVQSEPARSFNRLTLSVESYGYFFRFARTFDYVGYYDRQPGDTGPFRFEEDAAYVATLKNEVIEVYVTEAGVRYFSWANPLKTLSCANENVQLLPFEQIQANTVKLLRAGLAHIDGKGVYGYSLEKAILTVYPQRLADNQGTVMVPMWLMVIYTYGANSDDVLDFDPKHKHEHYPIYVGINAIDGSRVALADDS
ncbi:MAG: DUF6034 family protein [Clostridia bacterium]|nr:DUF6034 family protein [Clostridia bacterium]